MSEVNTGVLKWKLVKVKWSKYTMADCKKEIKRYLGESSEWCLKILKQHQNVSFVLKPGYSKIKYKNVSFGGSCRLHDCRVLWLMPG